MFWKDIMYNLTQYYWSAFTVGGTVVLVDAMELLLIRSAHSRANPALCGHGVSFASADLLLCFAFWCSSRGQARSSSWSC
jgi:hypothetical protein